MYLIINLGLKSIRGIVFTEKGRQVFSKAFPVHTTLFNRRVEQDASEWRKLLKNILIDLKENTNLCSEIRYISVTTSSSCILGVDDKIKPLTKVLMVSDKRSYNEVEQIVKSDEFKRTNSRGAKLTCATSSVVPKALWFKNNDTKVFDEVKYWIGAGEYLNYFFTKELFTDPLNASKAFFDGKTYNVTLLESSGLPSSTLPPVCSIGTTFQISSSVQREFGFSDSCKYILTTYDAICAVIGSNNGEDFNACDVSGTVTSVRLISNQQIQVNSNILLSQYVGLLDKYLVGASNNLGGGIIEWHKQAFYKKEASSSSVYSKMENAATKSNVGARGLLFLPYLLGERAPFVAPNASGSFFGIKRSSTIKDFTRAVFESTAYVTRDLIELIQNEGGINVNSLTVSGGLARFDLINQIKADVCNKPVYVVDNFESTSIGAFILMAITTKEFGSLSEALKNVVKVRKIINPSEENHFAYNKFFELFKELNNNLLPIYDKHKDLISMKTIRQNEKVKNL
ncbi:MAG: FGGY-family carbohydrate kinase [Cyclobacteriaceae bacterium]